MNKKKFIFFIRSYNDIDHTTPLINYLSDFYSLEVFSKVNLNRLKPNENINYLNSKNIKVRYLFDNTTNYYDNILETIFQFIYKLNNLLNPNEFLQKFFNVSLKFIQKKIDINLNNKKNWHLNIFNSKNIRCIFFDWSDINSFPYVNIVKYAKERNILVIGIPHGIEVFTNENIVNKKTTLKKKFLNNNVSYKFDYIFVQNQIGKKTFIKQKFKSEKIQILGSTRYDKHWIEIINKNYYKYETLLKNYFKDNQKINVVIFLNKLHYNVNKQMLLKAINDLSNIEHINLIIKPHTRGMRVNFFKIEKKNKSRIKIVNNNIPSYALSKWCHLGIVWGSSIGIQLVFDNKELIYPKFLHTNETIYDEYLKKCIVSSPKEMVEKINSFNLKNNNSYNFEQRKIFMNEIVNSDKIQPLMRHLNFLNELLDEKK